MRQLLEVALEVTRKGETVVLATIVRAQGPTPRATSASTPAQASVQNGSVAPVSGSGADGLRI